MNLQHPLSTSHNNLLPMATSVAPVNSPNPEETISNAPVLKTLEPSIPASGNNEQVSEASVISQPCIVPKIEKAEIVFIVGADCLESSDIDDLEKVAAEEKIPVEFFVDTPDTPLTRNKIRQEYREKAVEGATIIVIGHGMECYQQNQPLRLNVFPSKKPPPYKGTKSFNVLGETTASKVIVCGCLSGRGIHAQNSWGGKPVIFYGGPNEIIDISINKDMLIAYLRDYGQRKDKLPPRTFEETLAWWALHSTQTVSAHQPGKNPCISDAVKSAEEMSGSGLKQKLIALSYKTILEDPAIAAALREEAKTIPEKGFDPALQRSRVLSACLTAIGRNDRETVKMILNKFTNVINAKTSTGITPLHFACVCGHVEIVQLLLNNSSCSTNEKNRDGRTALMIACIDGYKPIVERFMKHPSYKKLITQKDNEGRNMLMLACINGHKEVAQLFINMDHADLAIQKDNEGKTALIQACMNGHKKIVELLLKHPVRADFINENDLANQNALLFACNNGYPKIVKLLLDESALDSINEQNINGFTALMAACRRGHTEIVKLLLKHPKCYGEERDEVGNNALMHACDLGHKEIVALLLENDSRLQNKNENGMTALMVACFNGHIEIVELLLNKIGKRKKPINFIESENNDNDTAFMLACANGHTDIVKLFLEKAKLLGLQLDLNKVNKNQETAFMLAEKNGHQNIVALLKSGPGSV